MNIEEARLYLEHTSKDDFNLEEHQKVNRYEAIQVALQEIERLKEEFEKEKYLVDKYTRQLTDEYKNTEYQCKEKERLNNIIKEVREYIEKYINRDFFDLENSGEVTIRIEVKGLLEILDKGE